MATKQDILNLLYQAIDDFNDEAEEADEQLEKSELVFLLGEHSKLDSLALVTYIGMVEQRLREDLNVELSLINSETINPQTGLMNTIGSLSDHIGTLL